MPARRPTGRLLAPAGPAGRGAWRRRPERRLRRSAGPRPASPPAGQVPRSGDGRAWRYPPLARPRQAHPPFGSGQRRCDHRGLHREAHSSHLRHSSRPRLVARPVLPNPPRRATASPRKASPASPRVACAALVKNRPDSCVPAYGISKGRGFAADRPPGHDSSVSELPTPHPARNRAEVTLFTEVTGYPRVTGIPDFLRIF